MKIDYHTDSILQMKQYDLKILWNTIMTASEFVTGRHAWKASVVSNGRVI